jgi:hypothetical protein
VQRVAGNNRGRECEEESECGNVPHRSA